MAPPLVAIPIITAVGRFAAPYLSKELGKLGINKFVSTYGKDAFTSLNQTLAADTPMVKANNVPMVNPNFASTDSDDDPNLPMVKDQNQSNQPQQEPPEDKGPNIGTEVATEAALEISKNLSKEEDIKSQTQKALEPKVEFGPLTETEKQTAQALMGDQPEFYSRVVKSIKDAKPNKLTKNKWKSFIQGDKQELKFLGLDKFLQGNESITKQELLDFVDQTNFANKLKVVEVPLEDQYDFSQYSIGGAGGKRAVSTLPYDYAVNPTGQKLQEGYKSTVEQYVFQVDNISFDEEGYVKELNVGDADTAHFPLKYAKNAIAHARVQTGYFDADAVEKRLNAKEADGVKLSNDDKILKSASRELEDTFIIDEIQSDAIQNIQKYGTKDDFVIIKGKDITQDFLEKNYPNYMVKPTPVGILEGKSNEELKDEGLIAARDNPNVLYSVDRDRDITGERGLAEVRLMDNNFYVFDKNTLVTKGSYKTEEAAQSVIDKRGYNPLPITESKKYVELVLNAMIKKAVEKDLDSIGITNGQIQYDRYDGQPVEDKEGLKKFYDEIVYKQLEKIAKKYNVKLETVELPGKTGPKDFDDVGLNEPTEASDSARIIRRTSQAIRRDFVLRKVSANLLASTINDLVQRTFEDPARYNDPNAVLPDYASIYSEIGINSGNDILENILADTTDFEESEKKNYYMWVKPGSPIEKALQRGDDFSSLSGVWDIRDINLQMPIASVTPFQNIPLGEDFLEVVSRTEGRNLIDYFGMVAEGTSNNIEDVNNYNNYILKYFKETGPDLKYMHEIIKMRIPKELQKDILSKPIKLSKAKTQTDRLLA